MAQQNKQLAQKFKNIATSHISTPYRDKSNVKLASLDTNELTRNAISMAGLRGRASATPDPN